jgi:hypothetical protein
LDRTGLVNNIYQSVINIDFGRKGFATRGKAEEGRISYEKGIAKAMTAFQEAQTIADPQTIILAEYTFLSQELEFCDKTDKDSFSSLTQAIQSFDDAFHIACISHKTRLQNVLRAPGIDPIEKALLKQRLINLSAGQGGYIEKQKKALEN